MQCPQISDEKKKNKFCSILSSLLVENPVETRADVSEKRKETPQTKIEPTFLAFLMICYNKKEVFYIKGQHHLKSVSNLRPEVGPAQQRQGAFGADPKGRRVACAATLGFCCVPFGSW